MEIKQEQVISPYRIKKEATELEIYYRVNELLSIPGAMRMRVYDTVMEEFGIASQSTVWQIRQRVARRLKMQHNGK